MEHDKLITTVNELRRRSLTQGYSLTYTVISGSMSYLISPGDTITVRGETAETIKRGDIIAWDRRENRGEYPVVHRVIERREVDGALRFRTKGDCNPFPDAEWVTPDRILGRVTVIHKKTLQMRIAVDTFSGKSIDFAVRGMMLVLMFLRRMMNSAATQENVPAKENENKTNLKVFDWDIGYYCNFKCFYCFTSGGEWERLARLQGPARSPEEIGRAWSKIRDSYGTCLIKITGGEPLEYPGFVEIAARLSRDHYVHVTSNLSRPVDALAGRLDPGRVAFNATFHPQYMDLETFLGRVLRLRAAGFTCDVCYLAHPSQLREMLEYRRQFLSKGITMTVIEFRGTYQGKEYPREYSGEERAYMQYVQRWQSGMLDAGPEAFTEHDPRPADPVRASRGEPCWAGSRYANVSVDGNVKPCGRVSGPSQGNIYSGDVALREGPFPCPVDPCSCGGPSGRQP